MANNLPKDALNTRYWSTNSPSGEGPKTLRYLHVEVRKCLDYGGNQPRGNPLLGNQWTLWARLESHKQLENIWSTQKTSLVKVDIEGAHRAKQLEPTLKSVARIWMKRLNIKLPITYWVLSTPGRKAGLARRLTDVRRILDNPGRMTKA